MDDDIVKIMKWIQEKLSTPKVTHNIFTDEFDKGYRKALEQIKEYIVFIFEEK